MRVLLIKQSSLGDLIHCFPAISDLNRQFGDSIKLDWLVEEGFASVPTWHKTVGDVLPVAFRRWRKNFRSSRSEINRFIRLMRVREYDIIIDAQALLKSAIIAKIINKNAKAKVVGLSRASIRTEKLCTLFYHRRISVPLDQHAIWRVRQLFAEALDYNIHDSEDLPLFPKEDHCFPQEKIEGWNPPSIPFILGVHSTTWESKHLPISWWHEFIGRLQQEGKKLLLPWYGEAELTYAKRIQADFIGTVEILPQLNLNQIVSVMGQAQGVIAVDSGYAHIAAAMGVPTLTLYGATNKNLTAALGIKSDNLQSPLSCSPCMSHHCQYTSSNVKAQTGLDMHPPCYQVLEVEKVYRLLKQLM